MRKKNSNIFSRLAQVLRREPTKARYTPQAWIPYVESLYAKPVEAGGLGRPPRDDQERWQAAVMCATEGPRAFRAWLLAEARPLAADLEKAELDRREAHLLNHKQPWGAPKKRL